MPMGLPKTSPTIMPRLMVLVSEVIPACVRFTPELTRANKGMNKYADMLCKSLSHC